MKSTNRLTDEANFTITDESTIGPKPAVETPKSDGSTATLNPAS
jgi:hypothetical protein